MKPKHEDLLWAAGFLDGQGSVNLIVDRRKGKEKIPGLNLYIRTCLSDAPAVMGHLFPGMGKLTGPMPASSHSAFGIRDLYAMRFTGRDAVQVLAWVMPLMRTKRVDKFKQVLARWEAIRRGEPHRPPKGEGPRGPTTPPGPQGRSRKAAH